jgi:UDPglucose 6-dehydrogenase
LCFLAVQTPNDPRFDGSTPLPEDRQDFNYSFLLDAVAEVAKFAVDHESHITLAVVSTCLPGTFRHKIEPLLNEYIDYVYTPQFIAMGTVIEDYLHPEFNLIGVHSEQARQKLEEFYKSINFAPAVVTDITTAEGIKVSYNTWITAKTVIANAWGELCDVVGMNFDDMYKAWSLSTKRLIAPAYMRAGMSDGGGCHPRDNIAMSWLAAAAGMQYNLWDDLMRIREYQEARHARIVATLPVDLPIILLGKAFKPGTDIQSGSPALLMASLLRRDFPTRQFTHVGENAPIDVSMPAIYFICTQHEMYRHVYYPRGSVIIDPFRYIPYIPGVTIYRLGRTDHALQVL